MIYALVSFSVKEISDNGFPLCLDWFSSLPRRKTFIFRYLGLLKLRKSSMVPENKFHIKEEKEKVKVLSSCMQFEYSWCLLMLMTV